MFQISKSLPHGAQALEIGSHVGSSAPFICAGLNDNNGHLFCVDTSMNQTMPDVARNAHREFVRNTKEYSSLITPIIKKSKDLEFEDIGYHLDFVFIDADRGEDAVRSDFYTLMDWVKAGGLVAFHDISAWFPGINIVMGEALASGTWQICGLAGSLAWIRRVG